MQPVLANPELAPKRRQRRSVDPRLQRANFNPRNGSFTLPGRSTAVFVQPRRPD
ncbi:alpha-1,6-glucosidase domain-containing protein [Microbulbifer sp. 2205BS26-8]|uniref:alpha-1,6-glucosidase domain-containing protein n=1 Tax=Microbulbifer sp. 2205BS26-8 TaxID=3064386 RepID=UPI00273F865C|nr:alpha-1,6-glucosidase domain-containing protein [Microbulbifer sp. 2205BS26-8]MDP5208634.1 DUF3372 domain-containing protein [Microbulbifer sp. 2205BS26-8]